MNKPRVSVIVPFYNGEHFVASILKAFSAQTEAPDELVLVNDGSTDGTKQALLQAQEESYPFKVTVVDRPNGGVSAARNAGIAAASGDYLMFCDCDDTVSSIYVETMRNAVLTGQTDLAFSYFCKSEEDLCRDTPPKPVVKTSHEFLKQFLFEGIRYIHVASAIFKRDLLEKHSFPEGYRYSEDVYLLWQLIALSEQVTVVPAALYVYFETPGSAMKTMNASRTDAVKLMLELEPFMEQHAPDFAPTFKKYCVARHIWSILWQATASFDTYQGFLDCVGWFDGVDGRMKQLSDFPDKKVRLTAALFRFSKKLYYHLMRFYVKTIK